MKTVGIIGRSYRNYTNQPIFQTSDYVRRALSKYDNVVPISLLPTGSDIYFNLIRNGDTFTEVDKKKLDHILKQCDGFIAPGGSNWFHFDAHIIQHAIEHDKPLLAICAGFQNLCSLYAYKKNPKLNIIAGDTHHQKGTIYTHTNLITPKTKLYEIIGQDEILVNSVHHFEVNFAMHDLTINAHSIDNIIEGVELPDKKFIIGVQWHPEYFKDRPSTRIFDEFIKNL